MEYIVEKIGMSRTVGIPSLPVTLLKVLDVKVCTVAEDGSAFVSYADGKKMNKAIQGQQTKYDLSKEFNRFATLDVANTEAGSQDLAPLSEATLILSQFTTKGRGFAGVVKRHGFAGGRGSHGHRMGRRTGSIGNAEWPGRVMKGKKMPGHYGNTLNSVKNNIVSFDTENMILVVKGSISGANGNLGTIKVVK
jgi:large subunit ribosomal protein L3